MPIHPPYIDDNVPEMNHQLLLFFNRTHRCSLFTEITNVEAGHGERFDHFYFIFCQVQFQCLLTDALLELFAHFFRCDVRPKENHFNLLLVQNVLEIYLQ